MPKLLVALFHVFTPVPRFSSRSRVFRSGIIARNKGLVKVLRQCLDKVLIIPEKSQIKPLCTNSRERLDRRIEDRKIDRDPFIGPLRSGRQQR